jgi:hypothetical protein
LKSSQGVEFKIVEWNDLDEEAQVLEKLLSV